MSINIFKTKDFNYQFIRTLGKATVNFAEIGECYAIAAKVEDGNYDSWYQNWFGFAAGLEQKANTCLERGHKVSARHLFFRASEYYRQSTFFHRVDLDCEELQKGFSKHRECLIKGFELTDYELTPFSLDYQDKKIYGLNILHHRSSSPRPVIIAPSGYDSTVEEMVYMIGIPALERGYNVVFFDGPGQGNTLYDPGNRFFMTHEYEGVLNTVVDYTLGIDGVDSGKIAAFGLSFGGFLMPKAVTEEPRISALILDPGQHDLAKGARNMMPPGLNDLLFEDTEEANERFEQLISTQEGELRLLPRMAVHGANSVQEYFRMMLEYKVSPEKLKNIKCPVLVCDNEIDTISTEQGKELYDLLDCDKEFIEFTVAEGAGSHCEITGRQIFFQKAFDWLDEKFSN
jgi:pimeloyl-ACP methyl ester carboxylesterase